MAFFQKFTKKPKQKPTESAAPAPAIQKHPKPKILLLDLPEAASKALIEKGLHVAVGTLGKPYRVPVSSGLRPLVGQGLVPNHTEQEIVIVDLAYGECNPAPTGEKHRPEDEEDLWGKCDLGFLDPRVRTAYWLSTAFDRTLKNGGLFVIFADRKTGIELKLGRVVYSEQFMGDRFYHDVWSLLPDLNAFEVTNEQGEEIGTKDSTSQLGRLLTGSLPGSHFTCTLTCPRHQAGWQVLAENKYSKPVAVNRTLGKAGSVMILPQIGDKAGFITKLLADVLPDLAPHLFPHVEKGRWLHRAEYELPRVTRLKAKQLEIEEQAKKEIANIESQIAQERAQDSWMQQLLTGTDAELVGAVRKALATFGFTKVIDIDAERDAAGASRREDLQIQDQSPLVVVDVKGISGCPQDADALQAAKHAFMRVKDLNRADIKGLTICNHQRHIPPLDRDSNPFRKELIDAAEGQDLGVMSAWDLYRLLRNFKKFGWEPQHVKPLFYQKGLIRPTPAHYTYCGTIVHVWANAFGIVTESEVRLGDKVAIEFEIEFEEAPVSSIQVNSRAVQLAKPGDETGIPWSNGMPKLREKMRVFRTRPSATA